jgi:hypothetical protein
MQFVLRGINDVLSDGTERPVQKRILWFSETFDGHVHDEKIAGEQPLILPSGITLWHDTGFIGHSPKNVTVKMPTENPKGKDLSEKQKRENRKISSFGIAVEHATGGVKRCRIVSDVINMGSMIRLCQSPAVCTTFVSLLKKAL